MEDFNSYSKNNNFDDVSNSDIFKKFTEMANKFDGKSQDELLKEIYKETVKGKQNGTLSNDDIDRFAQMLSPFLDDKKSKILEKVVRELKKI